jgi:hypothetical protein
MTGKDTGLELLWHGVQQSLRDALPSANLLASRAVLDTTHSKTLDRELRLMAAARASADHDELRDQHTPDASIGWKAAYLTERKNQAVFGRDIFPGPERDPVFLPKWRTSTVRDLAQVIYNDGADDRLPILADALMDAGCDSDDVLAHCRDLKQVHVRGCWVVDLVLDKE